MAATLTFINTTDLESGVELMDTVLKLHHNDNPNVVRLLTYGTRTIDNAAPAHDHEEDGGESLVWPIVSRSFGTYYQNISMVGIPLGPPVTGSFEETTSQGIVDKTTAKRLDCVGAVIPGGVKTLRISLSEYHESAGLDTQVTFTIRRLNSVNFKRGVAPEEVSADLSYTTVGVAAMSNHSVEVSDLSSLGDPTLDREVEIAVWLTSDVSATEEQRLLDWEVIALTLTAKARKRRQSDPVYPTLSTKELKGGVAIIGSQMAAKIKAISNGLNVGVWGSTPGLLPNGQPDRRRRYRETITAAHTHEGAFCPTATPGEILGKGACLKDTQSFAYLAGLDETLPLVAATPPTLGSKPNQGAFLHKASSTASGWIQYNLRRSIPAGCGALVLRVGVHAGYTFAARSYDTSSTLLMSISVMKVGTSDEIVTRLFCGEFASPVDDRDADFGFVELVPEDDVAHRPNRSLFWQGLKPWNHGAERTAGELSALKVNEVLYRVSKPIRVQLTYPPERASETYHETADYDVRCRFLMRNASGNLDTQAGCLWLMCSAAKGY